MSHPSRSIHATHNHALPRILVLAHDRPLMQFGHTTGALGLVVVDPNDMAAHDANVALDVGLGDLPAMDLADFLLLVLVALRLGVRPVPALVYLLLKISRKRFSLASRSSGVNGAHLGAMFAELSKPVVKGVGSSALDGLVAEFFLEVVLMAMPLK